MTPDALNKGKALLNQINDAQCLKSKHLRAVKTNFQELSDAEQKKISETVCAIHDSNITALQTDLKNLDGAYIAPAETQTKP